MKMTKNQRSTVVTDSLFSFLETNIDQIDEGSSDR